MLWSSVGDLHLSSRRCISTTELSRRTSMNSNTQGVSRRSFMRILGAASAAATSLPALAAMQQAGTQAAPKPTRPGSMRGMQLSPDTVVISSNENPLGPAQSALTAIGSTATQGGRYHFDEYVKTISVFNEQFG